MRLTKKFQVAWQNAAVRTSANPRNVIFFRREGRITGAPTHATISPSTSVWARAILISRQVLFVAALGYWETLEGAWTWPSIDPIRKSMILAAIMHGNWSKHWAYRASG